MPSNKREPTVFDIKKPKSGNSVRRWIHILKHATFKNHQNDADSLKTKPNHDSVPCTPESSSTDGEPEALQVEAEAEDPKESTGSHHPSSTTTPKSRLTLPTPSFEPLHQTLTSVPENTASPNTPEASSSSSASPSVPAKKSTRRQSRKTTMITPELMQQIQTSNRKHSSSPLLNGGELRTKTVGTATATNRAKEVLASPLRWSEQ